MSALVAGLVGAGAGALVSAALSLVVSRRSRTSEPNRAPELTAEDREAVAAEFTAHTTAVRRGISEYADQLAVGDSVLRELLAAIERAHAASDQLAHGPGGDR